MPDGGLTRGSHGIPKVPEDDPRCAQETPRKRSRVCTWGQRGHPRGSKTRKRAPLSDSDKGGWFFLGFDFAQNLIPQVRKLVAAESALGSFEAHSEW